MSEVFNIYAVLKFKSYCKLLCFLTSYSIFVRWGVGGLCFDFRAVRGPKTREVFMKHGCNVPEIYGDPALLFPYLYDPRPKVQPDPSIDMCIIPHMDDFSSAGRFEWWGEMNGTQDLSSQFTYIDHIFPSNIGPSTAVHKVRLIDIRTTDAAAFINIIITCKRISSASLYGLILAEAYSITWSWVKLNSKTEKEFKFHDFFLSVGIKPESVKVSVEY